MPPILERAHVVSHASTREGSSKRVRVSLVVEHASCSRMEENARPRPETTTCAGAARAPRRAPGRGRSFSPPPRTSECRSGRAPTSPERAASRQRGRRDPRVANAGQGARPGVGRLQRWSGTPCELARPTPPCRGPHWLRRPARRRRARPGRSRQERGSPAPPWLASSERHEDRQRVDLVRTEPVAFSDPANLHLRITS